LDLPGDFLGRKCTTRIGYLIIKKAARMLAFCPFKRLWAESYEKHLHAVFSVRSGKETYMAIAPPLTEKELGALRQIDTCMVANAVETFDLRLRNAGFTDGSIRCIFPDAPPMLGYAATARLRSGEPPIKGGTFRDRTDFWKSLLEVPSPRILVLEDLDTPPGRGAFVGEVHAAILKAMGCIGYLTNGAVRELPGVQTMGIQLFAGSIAVSRAYAHIFDIGASLSVGGMEIRPGELLHGDRHGVVSIPAEIAAKIPAVAAELRNEEQKAIEFCQSSSFSVAKISEVVKTSG
jgi:4-hydroxy-4-methyl-2-oxoglutarate aldolase